MIKLLFCGLGSIGRRHLVNVTDELALRGEQCVADALRSSDSPLPPGIGGRIRRSYRSLSELPGDYDIAFIANPSELHYSTLLQTASAARNFFIEKPVFTDPDVDVEALNLRPDGVCYVACPLRRSAVLCRVRQLLQTERPASAHAVCSSYLPDWRPGADYRSGYSAGKDGGGVRLDLIHEWDYLTDLFGFPSETACLFGKYSPLEIESEDTAVYAARYPSMLLTLHLDYTGRAPQRELTLYCREETILADILRGEIRFLKSGETERFDLKKNDIHREEICYFLDLAAGNAENVNPVGRAVKTLGLAVGRG